MPTLEDLQAQANELKARVEALEQERDAANAEPSDDEVMRTIGGEADPT